MMIQAMRRPVVALGRCAAVLLCATLVAGPLFAQDDAAKPTAESAAEQLQKALKSKQIENAKTAISELIGVYIDAYDAKDEKAQATVIEALGKALSFRGGDGSVISAAALGLGGMGQDAAKPLSSAVKDRRLRKEERLKPAYLNCIRALGQTKSLRDIKTLGDLLNDKDFDVIAAAAEAMGYYNGEDMKQSVRKKVAEDLIKALDSAYNAAEADPRNTTLQRKYEIVGPPLQSSLQKVTGASVGAAPEWRKWFNDNKKKRWN